MTPNERKLNQALRMLAEAGPREASSHVELALLAAFRGRQRKRKMTTWLWGGSAAAAIAAGVAMLMLMRPAPPPAVTPTDNFGQAQARPTPAEQKVAIQRKVPHARKPRRAIEETAEFYALPDADTAIPLDHATVVRVQMPMSDLRGLGLPINEQRATDRVEADVLVSQDGMARAVRFVQ